MALMSDLVELPYAGTSAFSIGLLAEDFRREYLRHGETLRWFKAFQVAPGTAGRDENGRLYVEQTTAADGETLVSAVRGLVYSSSEDVQDGEEGIIPAGSTMLSVLPDELPIERLDRVILTERTLITRRQVTRAASGDDSIFRDSSAAVPTPVTAIRRVWQGTTVYTADTHYTLVSNAVHWVSDGPAVGSTYAVEVAYQPVYTALGHGISTPMPDVADVLMPLRMALILEQPGQS